MRKGLGLLFILSCVTVFANDFVSFLPSSKPDIVQGEAIYEASCSQCHNSTAFSERAWKSSLTPVLLVSELASSSHTETLEFNDLWHVTSYIWTQTSAGALIKHGETLALEAERRMKKDALWLLLTKGQDIMNLQNRDWVLTHTENEIDEVIAGLAGETYTALSDTDKKSLIDYIYASYFTWPEAWRAD
jgi:hypothetical protein